MPSFAHLRDMNSGILCHSCTYLHMPRRLSEKVFIGETALIRIRRMQGITDVALYPFFHAGYE